MPCKNGAPPEWARRRLWLKHGVDPLTNIPWYRSPWGNEIVATCRKLVSGQLGCIEGSRKMAQLSAMVFDAAHGDKWLHKDWKIFFDVAFKDGELRVIENTFREQVRNAALKLLKEANDAGCNSALLA